MNFSKQPIRKKMMILMMVTSGFVLLLTTAAFISYELITYRRTLVENAATLAKVIADNSTAALAFRDPHDATQILQALKAESTVNAAALYDRNGQMFARYSQRDNFDEFPSQVVSKESYSFDNQQLIVLQPVSEGQTVYGTLYLSVSLSVLFQRLWLYLQITLLILCFSMFSAFILARYLQKSISTPIVALANAAHLVSEKKDYSVRVPKTSEDELGGLTETFNSMLSRIQESDAGLRKVLQEKDVLIQEIHHRVKNNLQVILSLLDMQSRYVRSTEAAEVFQDSKARIRSMSLVHELLYGASDLSEIDFPVYVEKLVSDLKTAFSPACKIDTIVDLKELQLNINIAVPLGLLLNEIVTNSFKHGFKDRSEGLIFVKQRSNGSSVILAGDNGIGIPRSINMEEPVSFGLKIIKLLARQLNAKITVEAQEGTVYRIELPSD